MSMQQDEDMLLQSIYEEYQGTLRRIARALNVPNMELEDVVQETFIAYFRKYSLTWSPTRKKAIDCLRKNGRYEKVSLDEENSVRCIEMLTTYVVTDPIDIIISEEAIQRITTEIANMRQEWKEMAVLYFLEQRTIPEICEMLEIPGTVCRSRIYRTRMCLKKILGPKYDI
ncbi:RNA polymerase sigma factor [Hungatella sp.]|uniref:RNA polymerase sigma factor n=1 Tax=Hungatella sp. TaxID=2613924 RepID=UPI002A83A8E9|nr:RNA polymerase sigma factor [Hungatella sp.]